MSKKKQKVILDIKKTQNIDPYSFGRDIYKFKYHMQAYDYLRLASLKYSTAPKDFVHLCIESNAPYECAYHKMAPDVIRNGEDMFNAILENIKLAYETRSFKISYPKLNLMSFEEYYPVAERYTDEFVSEQLHKR